MPVLQKHMLSIVLLGNVFYFFANLEYRLFEAAPLCTDTIP